MGVNLLYCLSVSLWCLLYTRIRRFFHSLSPKIDLSLSRPSERKYTQAFNVMLPLSCLHNTTFISLLRFLPSCLSIRWSVTHSLSPIWKKGRQIHIHTHFSRREERRKEKEREIDHLLFLPLTPHHCERIVSSSYSNMLGRHHERKLSSLLCR